MTVQTALSNEGEHALHRVDLVMTYLKRVQVDFSQRWQDVYRPWPISPDDFGCLSCSFQRTVYQGVKLVIFQLHASKPPIMII